MKKTLKILIASLAISLIYPLTVFGAIAVPWQAVNNTSPATPFNAGIYYSIKAPFFTASSTNSTSTLPIVSSNCFWNGTQCLSGTGSIALSGPLFSFPFISGPNTLLGSSSVLIYSTSTNQKILNILATSTALANFFRYLTNTDSFQLISNSDQLQITANGANGIDVSASNGAFGLNTASSYNFALNGADGDIYFTPFGDSFFNTHLIINNASTTNLSVSGFANVTGKTTLTNSSSTNETIGGFLNLSGKSGPAFLALDNSNNVITTTTPTGGSSLSGGSTNFLTYWTSPTTVGATSSPVVGFINATSTTPSTFINASTTNLTVTNPINGSITGTSSNVITNANLTGDVTSVGNVTTFGAKSGLGSTVITNQSATLNSPTFTSATTNTINGLTISTRSGNTLTIASSKTLAVNNSLTLNGTDGTTMTFPSTNATIARTDADQTFSGTQTFNNIKTATTSAYAAFDQNGLLIGTTTPSGGSPVGASSTIQFKCNTSFCGDSNLTWDTKTLTVTGSTTISGLVGIGTTTPQYKVDVNAGTNGALRLTNSNSTPLSLVVNNTSYGTGDGNGMGFYKGNTGYGGITNNGVDGLDIGTTGNVGFGTTTPSQRVVVSGSQYITGGLGVALEDSAAGTINTKSNVVVGPYNIANSSTPAQIIGGNFSGNSTQFPFIIFNGNQNWTGWGPNSAARNSIRLGVSGTPTSVSGTGSWPTFGTSQYELVIDGNLGVGTSTPGYNLAASGTVAFKGLTATSGGDAVCINTTTGELRDAGSGTCAVSSERFKENIKDLSGIEALSKIDGLRPVSFDYKAGYHDANEGAGSYGLIAEEVEKVDPLLVDYCDDGQVCTLHFEKITGLLIKAVQEIQNRSAGAMRTAEDNWQWIIIILLGAGFAFQQVQIKRLKDNFKK